MANATPQKLFKVELTRSQLELLEKMLSAEIAALESGYAHPHPQILKRTFDAVYKHFLPSPEEKQQRFEAWVKSCIVRRKASDALLGAALPMVNCCLMSGKAGQSKVTPFGRPWVGRSVSMNSHI